jgi:predicted RNA-binding protein with PIN domain
VKVFFFMAVIRILVDGYSLLHSWPEIAPGKPRFSAAARNELIQMLTRYYDAAGTPISVFFDGANPVIQGSPETPSTRSVEVLFSSTGQTADQMIERAAHRFVPYGEVLAVTDDLAERETVISLGGLASSCVNFVNSVETALAELQHEIKRHNRQERNKFNRRS